MRGYIPCNNCGEPTTILQGTRPPTVKVFHKTCSVLPAPQQPVQRVNVFNRMISRIKAGAR